MPNLTEVEAIDRIEVVGVEFPMVQVRKADIIYKDGVEIASSFHRHVLAPGDDISGEDPKVQAVCEAVWTDEIVAAYLAHLEAQKPAPEPEPEVAEEAETEEQTDD